MMQLHHDIKVVNAPSLLTVKRMHLEFATLLGWMVLYYI